VRVEFFGLQAVGHRKVFTDAVAGSNLPGPGWYLSEPVGGIFEYTKISCGKPVFHKIIVNRPVADRGGLKPNSTNPIYYQMIFINAVDDIIADAVGIGN